MDLTQVLPLLLGLAWLLPLASFALILFFGRRMGKGGHGAGLLATGVIITSFVLSVVALTFWLWAHPLGDGALGEGAGESHGVAVHAIASHGTDGDNVNSHGVNGHGLVGVELPKLAISGDWYALGVFGSLRVTIGYYIDALTLAMFVMVTLIASCIHVYSLGYMHEELHEVTDKMAILSSGRPLRRRGRFYRFYQYMSLFCFSMLGLVIAGNIAMVFVFWELVGICSYFLIGFYIERKSASNAANKAFIVNRVGDFGMIIGLMVIWTGMGTFSFGDYEVTDAAGKMEVRAGLFSQARPAEDGYQLRVPDGLVRLAKRDEIGTIVSGSPSFEVAEAAVVEKVPLWRKEGAGYWLLVVAGLGIFCGCVGKSAQFPLHVWLPDAMEGPTPVSALIHAATMVAAGVYLVGRFYPLFVPEVLLVIAYIGCITLFIAATMAITATDIKRVLAYSTVSQLGYMMLALGIGGWVAGLFHLFTHAFFKSLLFLCSGSVIHATGTNEMPEMGGLLKKMPYTAWTMLVGCLAISGAGIPLVLGLSGYYSKDAIIAQHLVHKAANPMHGWMFYVVVGGAGITTFYMFRLWYMTFAGKPRDEHVYEHAHESPATMVVPLVILATLAAVIGWPMWRFVELLEQARPAGVGAGNSAGWLLSNVTIPAEHLSHASDVHVTASLTAFSVALAGFVLATAFYGLRVLDADDSRRTFAPLYRLFLNRWWFDELYREIFIKPVLAISNFVSAVDRRGIDWVANGMAKVVVYIGHVDEWIDRMGVDQAINVLAQGTYRAGVGLRRLQTGNLRQYIMYLAVGMVALFVVVSMYWNMTMVGR